MSSNNSSLARGREIAEAAIREGLTTGVERCMRYALEVDGEALVASEKVRMACRRFLSDLARQEDEEWPWWFDQEKAERPIRFMERFLSPTKGDYDSMALMDWQCFCEANVYGWVSKGTGLRRFGEALIVVARGNGKSTLMAGNATYGACKDGEKGADIYLLANSKEQAGIVYQECCNQIKASPYLNSHFRTLRDGVYYDDGTAQIRHRSSDSRKLDGLNPHMGIFDEIHEYRDYKLINVIRRGMNKRRQPLALYITTMGTVTDGPLADYYGLFTDAMRGELAPGVGDRMFAYIAELDEGDDLNDTDTWIKANPSLGTLLSLDKLKGDWERAQKIPREKADFVTKQLNIMADTGDAAFVDYDVIKRNMAVLDEEALLGRRCYGGFDLSTREDFTAAVLEFPLDDGRFFVLQHSWVPERKVQRDNEKIPYYEWAMQGHLTIVPGEYVQQEDVYEWFLKMSKAYEIMAIGYDPANAVKLRQMLENWGFDCQVVRQGPLTLNDPMKDIKELLMAGKVVSNQDAMLRWYTGNVKISTERRHMDKENWMPLKRSRYRKIDGFVAWLCAHCINVKANPAGEAEVPPSVSVYTIAG